MTSRACWDAIKDAMKRPPTEEEVERITEAVQARRRSNLGKGMTPREAAREAGKALTEEAKLAKSIANRQAYHNVLIFADRMAEQDPTNPVKSEQAMLSGRAKGGRNNANGIDANHHSLRSSFLIPMVTSLKNEGLLSLVTGNVRSFNLDVARELYRRKDPTLGADTGNTHARRVAEILGTTMDVMRAAQNKAGASIGELEGYMGRQYHDMHKVRGKGLQGDFPAWRDYVAPKLNREAMAPDLSDAQFEVSLHGAWQGLAFGVHEGATNPALAGFGGSSNLAKKVSQGRSLIFKSADDWFEYNERFGKGTVMDAVWASADRAALATAVMDKLGNNPEAMFKRIHDTNLQRAADRRDGSSDKLLGNPNKKLLDVVLGTTAIPGNATLAHIGSTVRNVMQLTHLGGVIFSALPDLIASSATLRANGIPLWEALGGQLRAILPQGERRLEIAHSVGAGIDGMAGHIINRFRTEDGAPGAMAGAVNTFHKLNLLTPWTEAQKVGMGLALSHNLATHAGKEFSSLPPMMQDALRRYGIEAGEWDIGRATASKAADGRNYLLPAEVGDAAVRQKFQTYVTDQIREGLNEPTANARLLSTAGLQAGTVYGELFRSFFQFKGFVATYMERHLGRVMYRNGPDIPGMIYLAVGMTLMGYASNTLRDFATNKSPRRPEDALGWASVVRDAMASGGALGILGDAVFRDGGTTGASLMRSFAGPSISTAFDTGASIKSIYSKALEGGYSSKGTSDVAMRETQRLLGSLTPNLFYTRAVYEYLFPFALSEIFNPGTRGREERRMRERGQHFILQP